MHTEQPLPTARAFVMRLMYVSSFALLLVCCHSAAAQSYPEPSAREIALAYNTGLRFGLAPGVFVPARGGQMGFSVAGDLRYGLEAGPVILAPGVRLAGYFTRQAHVLIGLGTLRLTVPLEVFAPFVLGGAGPGYVSSPAHTGLAYLGGGGFMVHVSVHFAIGAELTYQAVTATEFSALSLGPLLLLAF